jgi:hypothetical protein
MGLSKLMKENPNYAVLMTTIRDGFPIALFYSINEGDTSTGVHLHVDDSFITTYKGEKCDWIQLTKEEKEDLEDQAFLSYTGMLLKAGLGKLIV